MIARSKRIFTDEEIATANALAEENMGLCRYVLKKSWHRREIRNLGYDDALSVAYIALVTSARYFDPDRGFKFSTYAARSIYNALSKASVRAYVVLLPIGEARKIRDRGGEPPSNLGEPRASELGIEEPEDDLDMDEEFLAAVLEDLPPRTRRVVKAKYGIGEPMGKAKTCRKISADEGISVERVRQVVNEAMHRLKIVCHQRRYIEQDD